MRYRLPFMIEDVPHNKWFNWGPPPPGTEVGGTAVVHNHFGKGQCVYLGVPIFQEVNRKLFWMRQWLPELVRKLVPDPVAELRFPALPEYLHGTFFWDKSRRFLLVQILNAAELATDGEFIDIPSAEILINSRKLKVAGARVVWPHRQDLEISTTQGKTRITVPKPGRYTALYLKVV